MSKQTSIRLPDDIHRRALASGATFPELIRRGLDAEPMEAMIRRVVREELASREDWQAAAIAEGERDLRLHLATGGF